MGECPLFEKTEKAMRIRGNRRMRYKGVWILGLQKKAMVILGYRNWRKHVRIEVDTGAKTFLNHIWKRRKEG